MFIMYFSGLFDAKKKGTASKIEKGNVYTVYHNSEPVWSHSKHYSTNRIRCEPDLVANLFQSRKDSL